MSKRTILLCAGGTGGHLFPAEAVALELKLRGYEVHLAADDRVRKFANDFPADEIHQIKSASLASKKPLALARSGWALFSGYWQSRKLLSRIKPEVVAGFGGYPTVPPVLAATRKGIPTLVHESNAVLGRANRFLGNKVDRIAIGFGRAIKNKGLDVIVTGNPVRKAIIDAAKTAYPKRTKTQPFNLLVFGGSQGAAFFSECVPDAIERMDEKLRVKINVVQQARQEDEEQVRKLYKELGVKADVRVFFDDMAEKLAEAHLVVCRAGASTVSELAVVGRPSILVPYPHALDHDQATNAAAVSSVGGATLFNQSALTPTILADELTSAIQNPKKLEMSAENAKTSGKPDAAAKLADMMEALANGG